MARKGRYGSGLSPFGGAPITDLSVYQIDFGIGGTPYVPAPPVPNPAEATQRALTMAASHADDLAWAANPSNPKNAPKPLPKPKAQADAFVAAPPPPKPVVAPASGILPVPAIPTVNVSRFRKLRMA